MAKLRGLGSGYHLVPGDTVDDINPASRIIRTIP